VAVETGHTDTDKTTALHMPSIGLVAAGDVAYNGVHQYILEGGHGGLREWLRALDRVAGLHPRAVVAGHKNYAELAGAELSPGPIAAACSTGRPAACRLDSQPRRQRPSPAPSAR
jgi:hypothetical protein